MKHDPLASDQDALALDSSDEEGTPALSGDQRRPRSPQDHLQHGFLRGPDGLRDAAGHPALKSPLTLDSYLALDHIRVAQSLADRRFIDNELARLGVVRRVPLQVQHWLSAPEIVKHTNLVSATWEKIAARYSQNGELVMLPLPFGPLKYMFKVYWHRRYEKNAAHRWLRGIVLQSRNHRLCVDQAKR
jgi:DNA-binding transcriptional LysR family regulator